MNPAPGGEPGLVAKVLATHDALARAGIGHAFGGALALAYWTDSPRATADIDMNISLPPAAGDRALAALPPMVTIPDGARQQIGKEGQIRVRWGRTPIDLFFRVTTFHDGVAARSVLQPFAGRLLPFVCAEDLAVLKSLFDRPRDWVDIEAMFRAGTVGMDIVVERVASIVGEDDQRIERLQRLTC